MTMTRLLVAALLSALTLGQANAATAPASAPVAASASPAKAKPAARPTAAAASAAAKAAIPFPQALVLIRSTLTSLDQADQTGSYMVMSALGNADFRSANPAEKLATQFAAMRGYNISAILVTEPKFTQLPTIDGKGVLSMAGFYALDPYVLSFRLAYAPESNQWRLAGLAVSLDEVKAAPPGTPVAPKKP
jgi:hypothetical protein